MKRTTRAGRNTASHPVGRRARVALGFAAVLLLASCGSGGEPDPADATATALAMAPTGTPPAIPLEIGEVTWASGVDSETGAPVDPLTSLPNDAARVVAALKVPSIPAGTTVQASWTIDGDPMPNLDPAPIVVEQPLEDAWLSWSLTWNVEEPWPIGTLGIVVQVDGQPPISSDIPIVRARR